MMKRRQRMDAEPEQSLDAEGGGARLSCGFLGKEGASAARSALLVVVQQAEDVVLLEALAALQEVELDGKAARPAISPPSCFTSLTVASMVPPVASRSSTSTTRWPGCDRVQ
jgi:hypothetical protein